MSLVWCAGVVGSLMHFRAEPPLRRPPPAPDWFSVGSSSQLIMAGQAEGAYNILLYFFVSVNRKPTPNKLNRCRTTTKQASPLHDRWFASSSTCVQEATGGWGSTWEARMGSYARQLLQEGHPTPCWPTHRSFSSAQPSRSSHIVLLKMWMNFVDFFLLFT